MSNLHALIRACKAEPEDNAPRLILADWLDEHDAGERAAFIRRQIADPENAQDCYPFEFEWRGTWDCWRQEKLRATQGSDHDRPSISLRRGFFHISDLYQELYEQLPKILHPPFDWTWIESMNIGSWHNGDWTPLFESPRLLELTSLRFVDDHYNSKLLLPLSSSQYLSTLKNLSFYMVSNGHDGFRRMSENEGLSNLRSLEFFSSDMGRKGAHAFSTSKVWDNLQICSLRSNRFTDAALSEFAQGRIKPNLELLDISHGFYTDTGLVRFSRSELFPQLRELRIGFRVHRNEDLPVFGPFGIESLLTSTQLRFERLSISIVSESHVPRDIVKIAEQSQGRVELDYRNLRRRTD